MPPATTSMPGSTTTIRAATHARARPRRRATRSRCRPRAPTEIQPASYRIDPVKEAALEDQVRSALDWLKSHATKATLDGMARYAIPSDHAYGVAMKDIKALG